MIEEFQGKYRFLSNFYPSILQGLGAWKVVNTVEHAYQAWKTNNFEEQKEILNASTAGIAKRLGNCCTMREDWEEIKLNVMFMLVYQKFSLIKEYREKLLATGNSNLIEGNYWHDNYWGNCVCGKPRCSGGMGENHLGKILMKVRSVLKGEI